MRVVLHIGEPKTGTTFLQQVMWRNRAQLAAHGVTLPGHHPQDHFRAVQDLRDIVQLPSDPAGSWSGEWDVLTEQARRGGGTSVISHELLCAATAAQAERAVRSLDGADVHVVLTVRDMATLLPAEWQETIKHRNTRAWHDWLGDVIDEESHAAQRREFWFWRVHDTVAILDLWARYVPRERVHVVTMPPRGSDPTALWKRFASVLDVDPGSADTSLARQNPSLGMPEIELLRRVNSALSEDVPGWFYMWNVKETLAHKALAARGSQGSLTLPDERWQWAGEHDRGVIEGIRAGGCDIVGNLDELLPAPPPAGGGRPPVSPDDASTEQMLDAAVDSIAALVETQFRRRRGAQRAPQRETRLADRLVAAVSASPRLKRGIRSLSSRSRLVAHLRVRAWQALERSRAHR